MLDDLLPYYNQELHSIYEDAANFAKTYPKIAKHLNITHGKIEDPDVALLLEAFAFLTAHIQYKLNDDFPEISEALLSTINDSYLSPVPSCSIIQFNFNHELSDFYLIPKNTLIETNSDCKEKCKFNTLYPVDLWPIEITNAEINEINFSEFSNYSKDGKGCIKIRMKYINEKNNFCKIPPQKLRFFINAQEQIANIIYKIIFKNTLVIIIKNPITNQTIVLNPNNIKAVGFDTEESLLPNNGKITHEHNLIFEYFTFPEKFLFFEVDGLNEVNLTGMQNEIEIMFVFDEINTELIGKINKNTFKLGCAPIINIFKHIAEPVNLNNQKTRYKIIPDTRLDNEQLEMHTVKNVVLLNTSGMEIAMHPLYNINYTRKSSGVNLNYYWYISRRMNTQQNFEMYISFADMNYEDPELSEGVVYIETLCTNANLPSKLPVGVNTRYLHTVNMQLPLQNIEVLMPFTLSVRPKLRDGARWKIIAHLVTNFLSIGQDDIATDLLKTILIFYNFKNTISAKKNIDSILKVNCKKIVTRVIEKLYGAVCQGIEITIELDSEGFVGNEMFIFGNILDMFFAKYVTINSFSRLIFVVNGEVYNKWPIRLGKKTLL